MRLLSWLIYSGSNRVLGDTTGIAPSVQPEITLGGQRTSGPEGGERPALPCPSITLTFSPHSAPQEFFRIQYGVE